MLRIVLTAALVCAAGAAQAADADKVVGRWRAEALPGVATIPELTFTPDGRLVTGDGQFLGRYRVSGREVVARSGQVAYAYALTDDGRLCVSPGPSFTPLGKGSPGALEKGQCYRSERPSSPAPSRPRPD